MRQVARNVGLACLLLLAGCARPASAPEKNRLPPEAEPAIDRLLGAMRQRLLVMHDVARWKWNAQAPIHDPAREQAILDGIVSRSKLDAGFVRAFFTAQFTAARQLQEDDFRQWEARKQAPFPEVAELNTRLRPRIDAISNELLETLAVVIPFRGDPAAENYIRDRAPAILCGDGITDDIRDTAIAPLLAPRRE